MVSTGTNSNLGSGSGNFIQPYPSSQTTAKDLILAKKGIAKSSGSADPYTRNLFLTLYAQEIYGGGK